MKNRVLGTLIIPIGLIILLASFGLVTFVLIVRIILKRFITPIRVSRLPAIAWEWKRQAESGL